MSKIIVFGASITYGAWDLQGGWVDRLKQYCHRFDLEDKFYYLVENLGISGDTSKGVLERFESETKVRTRGKDDIIIVSIGINDSQWLNNENKWRVSQEEFKNNIQEIINLAKKYTDKLILIGLNKSKDVDPIPWAPEKSYKNERIEIFDKIIKEKSQENNIHFINVLDLITEENLEDGLHPNTQGHKKIFERVKNFIEENKLL